MSLFSMLFRKRSAPSMTESEKIAWWRIQLNEVYANLEESEAKMYRYKAALMDTTRGLRRIKRKCERQQARINQLLKEHGKQAAARIMEIATKVEGNK